MFLWWPFHSFLALLQWIFFWLRRIIGRRCRCFHQRICWHKQWVRLFCQKSPCSVMVRVIFFTHICNCSRIRSHHLLPEWILRVEECLVFFATGYDWSDRAPGSVSIHNLSRIGTILVDEQVVESLLSFVVAFERVAEANSRLRLRGLLLVSNFHSIFTLQVAGCDFQHGSNFGVHRILLGSVDFSSRGLVYSRHVTSPANY